MKKIGVVVLVVLSIAGCTIAVLRDDTPRHDGEFLGNYSALARCVTSKLEQDKRWSIMILRYDVRTYPDNESAEITGTQVTDTITAVHFLLTLVQKDANSVRADIEGYEDASEVAWEYLSLCAEQGPA